ncbi:TerB family tellurite resistance protein [bacterium]|nr:TerB family tellurite resistance protein [bacterium]
MGFWKNFTADLTAPAQDSSVPVKIDKKLAACVLLLEMAYADDDFGSEEETALIQILMNDFNLSQEEADALHRDSIKARKDALDLYSFTEALNKQMSKADRIGIVERLWEIVYADGRLDGHEDHLIHRLAELLHLEHSHLINAKLKVKQMHQ